MNYIVSRSILQDKIGDAARSDEGFLALRDFVFDYYAAEDDYVFEPEAGEAVFAVLLPYLQVEEAFGDDRREQRMKWLGLALEKEFTAESAVAAISRDRIARLLSRRASRVISEEVFQTQLRKLSPARVDWEAVLKLYESYRNSAPDERTKEDS